MDKTLIWVVKRSIARSMFPHSSNDCFFLNKEDAEYYIATKERDSTGFLQYWYQLDCVEAGQVSKDKEFDKWRKNHIEENLKKLHEEKKELNECTITDFQKIADIDKSILELKNKKNSYEKS